MVGVVLASICLVAGGISIAFAVHRRRNKESTNGEYGEKDESEFELSHIQGVKEESVTCDSGRNDSAGEDEPGKNMDAAAASSGDQSDGYDFSSEDSASDLKYEVPDEDEAEAGSIESM